MVSAIATDLRTHATSSWSTRSAEGDDLSPHMHGSRSLLSACIVSLAVHACLLSICGLVWYRFSLDAGHPETIHSIMSVTGVEDSQVSDLEVTESFTVTEMSPPSTVGGQSLAELQAPLANPADSLMPAGQPAFLSWSDTGRPWENADVGRATVPVGAADGSRAGLGWGDGFGNGEGSDAADSFFGLRPVGRRVVFVLDCSRSMNHPHNTDAKTRFKRMKVELIKAIQGMGPESEFYLIFFNDFAIPMPARGLVPAADQPKLHYLNWMKDLKADGNTEPREALQLALRMQPDILYFLTDGSFTWRVQQDLLRLQSGRTEIHTFAFDAPFSDSMRRAYLRLLDDDRAGARETVGSRSDYRKLVEAFSCHQFMKQMARRHGGRFRLIPYDG